MTGAERKRMEDAGHPENGWREASPWYEWGPYLSERAWGGVREDYSAGGDAWDSFPHDHARSRAYRWNEDGMAGMTDVFNRLSLALALWNGKDPILKERMFGLTEPEGNHGEDVKEYWWYLDARPEQRLAALALPLPAGGVPVRGPRQENRARSKLEPEYELLDTGIFDDDRYWIVEVHYAKASPTDILMRVIVRNRGPETATLHVLPTLWFRNEWAWNPASGKPELRARPGRPVDPGDPRRAGRLHPRGRRRRRTGRCRRCCSARTRRTARGSRACPTTTPYPKDGINDHVVGGAATVNPDGVGTKAPPGTGWTCPPGRRPRSGSGCTRRPGPPSRACRGRPVADDAAARRHHGRAATARPRPTSDDRDPLGPSFAAMMRRREAEADEFYEDLRREGGTDDEQRVMRQAFAGMLWSKQYYGYNVARWLDGDPGLPPPPPERADRAGTRPGGTSRPPTSCRCPIRGSTRGSPPGTSRSTRSPSPTSTRRSRSTSSCCCAASGSSTRTARCRPTSGRSTTSTRPSTPPPRYLVWHDRRAQGHDVPQADLPQAAAQLHVVAEPPGQGGQRPLLGRVPGPRQHRRVRPLAPARRARSSSSRTRRPGCSCTA